ncbi:YczE/YyaS/YitT family protein [Mitsuokella sp. WILCCON 0060]|uniref:YczE/YyaS/YitT family protein n=1 Tax=unclassified Mitsuokella TaxID=2637239 RepID=UPI003F06BF4C
MELILNLLHPREKHAVYSRERLVRTAVFAFALTLMASSTSLLRLSLFGNDPFSCMNLGFSLVSGLSFGTCLSIFNVLALVLLFFCGRRYISIGTWIYLFALGPMADVSYNLLAPFLTVGTADLIGRSLLLISGILISTFGVSLYMCSAIGMGPYDAISWIVEDRTKGRIPFRYARIALDVTAVIIGFAFGSIVGLGTLIMACGTGPLISFHSRHFSRPLLQHLLNVK